MCAGSADAVLLIFTLAAVAPAEMPAVLQTAFQVCAFLYGLKSTGPRVTSLKGKEKNRLHLSGLI